jgi:hypothetical protein
MTFRTSIAASCTLAALLFCGSASAAGIRFAESALTAVAGETFSVDLLGDFTNDATLGGGLDIGFDGTVIEFLSFDFSTATFTFDTDFTRNPDVGVGKAEGLAFGRFAGVDGAGIIGTASFRALQAGSTTLTLGVTTDALKGGPFVSANTFAPHSVSFESSTVTISAVPLPGAAWLFGSALCAVTWRRRR